MKKLMSLLILAAATVACTDDDIRTEQDFSNGPKVVGFAKSVENFAYFEDTGVETQNVQVTLIGLGNGDYPASPVDVTYEVDLENSTATEGQEFDFADETGKITIPAGGSFANLPILINTGQLNPTAPTELYLKLTSSNGAAVGAQYNTLKIVFVGCATELEGTYRYGTTRTATVTKIAPNVYRSSYMPAFASTYWFEFSDVCGDLEILDWQFQGGNPCTGADGGPARGEVLQPSGNLRFSDVNVAGVSWYVNLTWTLVRQ